MTLKRLETIGLSYAEAKPKLKFKFTAFCFVARFWPLRIRHVIFVYLQKNICKKMTVHSLGKFWMSRLIAEA